MVSEGNAKNYKVLRQIDCSSGEAKDLQINVYEKDVFEYSFKSSKDEFIVPGSMDESVMKNVCSGVKHKTRKDVTYSDMQQLFISMKEQR